MASPSSASPSRFRRMTSTARMARPSIVAFVTETVRVLLVGVLWAGAGLGAFALRVARIDPTGPQRLIGELRLSQWMALVLAAVGGAWTGAAATRAAVPLGTIEITLAIATMVFAAWTLH